MKVSQSGRVRALLSVEIERESLEGNLALACHGMNPPSDKNRVNGEIDHARYWFSDWEVSGNKISINRTQTIGPIL